MTKDVIGRNVFIDIIVGDKTINVLAKVDSGAYSSSLSKKLAEELKLDDKDVKPSRENLIKSASGVSEREFFKVKLKAVGKEIESEINIADRSGLKYEMILGRKDISKFKFLVDVSLKANGAKSIDEKKVIKFVNFK